MRTLTALFLCLIVVITTCVAEESLKTTEEVKSNVEEDENKFVVSFPGGHGDDEPVAAPGGGGTITIGTDDDESGPIPIPVGGPEDEESHEIECNLFNMLECGLGNFCKGTSFGVCNGTVGICTGIPLFCSATYAPVCGCNGQTYSNECRAHAEMQNIAYTGECKEGERLAAIENQHATKVDISIEKDKLRAEEEERIRLMKQKMKENFNRKRGRRVK